MTEPIGYLVAMLVMFFLLFDFRKRGRKQPEVKNFGVSNKALSKVATIVIAICIFLVLFMLTSSKHIIFN
jgi:heme/copper-type cytochrome/quinol oxidase subunit 2